MQYHGLNMPDLSLPIDDTFAMGYARRAWVREDGTTTPIDATPPPDIDTLRPCRVAADYYHDTCQLLSKVKDPGEAVAAFLDCPCGMKYASYVHLLCVGGTHVPTGHDGYMTFGLAITGCKCGRLLWATIGDTDWCRSYDDLLPKENLNDDTSTTHTST